MRPILLKGHERPITCVKYSREGDLLFTASKGLPFCLWYTENGERIGTFNGHTGAVWSVDCNKNTTHVLSGSADTSVKLWDAELGKELCAWVHRAPVRSVNYAAGEKSYVSVTDQVLGFPAGIYVWDVNSGGKGAKPSLEVSSRGEAKILQALWGDLNRQIITANEDGSIKVYDVRKSGEVLKVINEHQKSVMQISYTRNETLFISASKDGTAKLFDAKTFQPVKTYHTGRPINSSSVSPIKEEVILAGGQSADQVTTTRVDNTQFRVRFYHLIFEEELGSLPGHFGPVNCVSYSPDGKGFSSGGEDGYVRLHHFDADYFTKFGKEKEEISNRNH